ncbi:MAG: ATP-binding protein [Bacillota bacterium]|nr:ATP-binding protein [Bacillota bacterium]
MKKQAKRLKSQIDSLTVFSHIKEDKVISKLSALLEAASGKSGEEGVRLYSDFVASLYPHTVSLTEYIRTLMIQDDNFYVKGRASGASIDTCVLDAVDAEIEILQALASIDSNEMKAALGYDGYLPAWRTHEIDLRYDFMEKLKNITKTGYGIFAKYDFFRVEDGDIIPVAHPDYQQMNQLFEYERERDLILKNTEALVNGTGASNMLLYGDAGTGKSSTIKAVAHHLAPQGLRIIEVKKNQLYQIPKIMEELAANPLKFILFIDDLSFTGNDDNFSALKATLEGSISGCGDNAVIYATSNRRHLVKESFGDRMGDELHLNDTMQETMSLAARFGLTITFQKPDKDEYLSIVKSLAAEYGIDMPEEELFKKAEAHAIRKNGRSPRTAKQFIELLKIGI